ncbi:MAG: hypothetical protein PHQ47_00130 [Candidatus Portnoybacteria bacterium]|nr:hypothetical protein [Candidatus Portnoybacteria bacterium]
MDIKLQEAFKKAQAEIESAGIADLELKKIAFAKAIDYFLKKEGSLFPAKEKSGLDFWPALSNSTGFEERKLKDIYAVDGDQIRLVIDKEKIPGERKSEKQRSLAALVLLAYHNGLGQEWVASSVLAEAAKHSKLYDTSKYSKNLKHEWFRAQGVRKGLAWRLSASGLSQVRFILLAIAK